MACALWAGEGGGGPPTARLLPLCFAWAALSPTAPASLFISRARRVVYRRVVYRTLEKDLDLGLEGDAVERTGLLTLSNVWSVCVATQVWDFRYGSLDF